MRGRRFVIGGTGRSGTLYLARVLTAAGLPTSHELAFRPPLPVGLNRLRDTWKRRVRSYHPAHGPVEARFLALRRFVGDASWMSVPHFADLSCVKVAVTREPYATIDSMRRKMFFNNPSAPITGKYVGEIFNYQPGRSDNEALFWLTWTRAAVRNADLVIRLEDFYHSILERSQP